MGRKRRRLSFRPTTRSDLEEVLSLWNDGRVTRWVGFPEGLGYGTARMEEWFVALQDDPDRHHFVVHAEGGGFCGELYYRVDQRHKTASLDIKFVPAAQGQGLATEALKQLIDHVFETEEGVDAVCTEPRPENLASQKLYGRCGMAPEPRPAHLGDGPPLWVRRRTDRRRP